MKLFAVLALIAGALTSAHAAGAGAAFKVKVFLDATGGQSTMAVEMEFAGHERGETELLLPNEWGGQRELYRAIRDIAVDNATLNASEGDPARRTLKHAPGATIKLRYRIAADADGAPAKNGGNDYRVQLRPDLIFALGNAWVIEPSSLSGEATADVQIVRSASIPAFASDLEHHSAGRPLNLNDIVESVLIAGAVRTIDASGGARLAIYGKIDARDDAGWRDAFAQIAAAQRQYWGASEEPYLVTILTAPPVSEGSISIGGTGRSDAFAFFTTTNAGAARLDQILAHEMMHTWVPRRIGGMPEGGGEALNYWLSEGFTDWTSWRVLARSRFWKPKDFAAVFNEAIKEYDLSPVRNAPNERIQKDFWNDRDVDRLPYRRGMLLATYWDGRIRKATGGARDFDDILLRMQSLAAGSGKATAATLLQIAMREAAGIDIAKDLARFVDAGVPADLPKDTFGLCGDLVWIDRPKFHRGFDIEATQKNGNVITGVVKGGPAEKAGLRDGMKLVKRSGGEIGNSQAEIAYDVLDGEVPKTLRWMPEGPGREKFRQFKLADNLTGERETACSQRLGGI